MISTVMYFFGLLFWLVIWKLTNGYELMRKHIILYFPFIICILYLFSNMLFSLLYGGIGNVDYEESRFNFIDKRVGNAICVTSSTIVIATIVYSLAQKKLPVEFIKFMIVSFIFLLTVSTPILWIPIETPFWFRELRDFQTVGFTYALFLCTSGIIILLKDLPQSEDL